MPALAMAMSSSLRWACLNSLTYSSFWVKGMNTFTRISVGCRSTRLHPLAPLTCCCYSPVLEPTLTPTTFTHLVTHPDV